MYTFIDCTWFWEPWLRGIWDGPLFILSLTFLQFELLHHMCNLYQFPAFLLLQYTWSHKHLAMGSCLVSRNIPVVTTFISALRAFCHDRYPGMHYCSSHCPHTLHCPLCLKCLSSTVCSLWIIFILCQRALSRWNGSTPAKGNSFSVIYWSVCLL